MKWQLYYSLLLERHCSVLRHLVDSDVRYHLADRCEHYDALHHLHKIQDSQEKSVVLGEWQLYYSPFQERYRGTLRHLVGSGVRYQFADGCLYSDFLCNTQGSHDVVLGEWQLYYKSPLERHRRMLHHLVDTDLHYHLADRCPHLDTLLHIHKKQMSHHKGLDFREWQLYYSPPLERQRGILQNLVDSDVRYHLAEGCRPHLSYRADLQLAKSFRIEVSLLSRVPLDHFLTLET